MPRKLGILAGGGNLPVRLVETCRQAGRDVFVIAFEGQAEAKTVRNVPHAWVRLGAAEKTLEHLRETGCQDIVMAGHIRRPSVTALRPDMWAAKFLARSGAAFLGDDGLLKALVRELEEKEGFHVLGADDILPDSLATEGVLGSHAPDAQALGDIRRGIEVASDIGGLDIGQGAVVQEGIVLAVEAAEGTDAMLARVADLKRDGPGGVLVKVKKPDQERRADLPAIGPRTVRRAAEAGLRGIAIEAGGALVIDKQATIELADTAGLFVVGVSVPPDGSS